MSSTFSDEVANNGLGYLDPFNSALDKGSSDYDARHRASISAVVPLPFFEHTSSRILKEAFGGFSLAPIYTYHSGYPFTMFDCTNSGSPYNCPRADIIPGSAVPKSGSGSGGDTGGNVFNYVTVPAVSDYTGPQFIPGTTTAMPFTGSNLPTCTGLFHQGCSFPSNMLSRNSMVGPGNWNLNLGVYKDFRITERVGLQLRGEFFNIANHKNFYVVGFGQGGADVSVSNIVQAKKGGFGNTFDDHRDVQLALKLTF